MWDEIRDVKENESLTYDHGFIWNLFDEALPFSLPDVEVERGHKREAHAEQYDQTWGPAWNTHPGSVFFKRY